MAGAHEGLAVANFFILHNNSLDVSSTALSLQRNVSFSTKRGSSGAKISNFKFPTISPGDDTPTTGLDLADNSRGPTQQVFGRLPDDILADYKDAVIYYEKCR